MKENEVILAVKDLQKHFTSKVQAIRDKYNMDKSDLIVIIGRGNNEVDFVINYDKIHDTKSTNFNK